MVLHTLNVMPGTSAFSDCLRCAATGDAILLLGEGVYAALAVSAACAQLQQCPARVLVLDTDRQAAGMAEDKLAFPTIDMDSFVALTEYYPRQLAWY